MRLEAARVAPPRLAARLRLHLEPQPALGIDADVDHVGFGVLFCAVDARLHAAVEELGRHHLLGRRRQRLRRVRHRAQIFSLERELLRLAVDGDVPPTLLLVVFSKDAARAVEVGARAQPVKDDLPADAKSHGCSRVSAATAHGSVREVVAGAEGALAELCDDIALASRVSLGGRRGRRASHTTHRRAVHRAASPRRRASRGRRHRRRFARTAGGGHRRRLGVARSRGP